MTLTIKDLPGPKGYPVIGNITKLDLPNLHKQFEDWADEFGDVYMLDLGLSNQVVVTRPSLIQKIMAARPKEFIRQEKMDNVIREATVSGVFNAEGEDWKLHRSMVAKGLDVKHQKDFYPAIEPVLERLYKKWCRYAESGETFSIQQDLLRFTVDVTSTLAFGYPMNTLEQNEGAIQEHMEKIFPMLFKRINQPIPWHRILKKKADKEFDEAVIEMNKLVAEFIDAARKRIDQNPSLRENPSTVIEAILVASEEEDNFSDEHVRGNLLTLLLAGEDTTAHTLSWIIYLLNSKTLIQASIREEANNALGEDAWAKEYRQNSSMKYIEAVAFESMRFKPVAPVLLFQATEDIQLEEFLIPKGQRVLTQNRHGALREENFTAADSFNPERWLKASKCPVHNTDAFTPFGGGARYCPGRNLAILEIRMVIAMLYKNFEVEVVTPNEEIREIMAFTMMASEYQVRLKKRV